MRQLTFEKLEQRHKELVSRSFSDPFPQSASEWKRIFQHKLIDSLPVCVAILDNAFVLQDCNKTYADSTSRHSMLGKGIIGKSIFDYMPGIEASSAGKTLHGVRNSGSAKIDLDREINLKFTGNEKKPTGMPT